METFKSQQALAEQIIAVQVKKWQLDKKNSPYEVLEVLPGASLEMVKHIYRVIALQVHPDANPTRANWANEMMKRLNEAYGQITKER